MRTTVTLEPDLAKKVKTLAHRLGVSFKQALNEVIRRGLTAPNRRGTDPRFKVAPHAGGFRPGIDPGKLNQLVDQLEHQCELHSNDTDFGRFPGLRWRNPL